MAFVKAQKTKAYFKRFQVKFKRRRGIVVVSHYHEYAFSLLFHC
uniref:Uncharacterized protein n=1 Tax=Rhizophora mucronata TaxID=61149 RepID=A0A2P2MT65_RHIMU